MHVQPPDNPTEDRFINLLDRRIPLDRREGEMADIRRHMLWRERCRLAELRRLATRGPAE